MTGGIRAIVVAVVLALAGSAHAAPAGSAAPARAPAALVDLNSAGADELCTLPGIGPKKAEAILAFRSKRPFTRVTQLLEVKGIGKRTLDRLRPLVVVRSVVAAGEGAQATPAG